MKRLDPGAEMPFLDHLEELRVRLFWVIGSLVVGTAVALVLHQRYNLVELLIAPAKPYLSDGKLLILNPADNFTLTLTICIWLGVIFALPVVIYHIWAFVAPAMYASERRVGVFVLAGALALFLIGAMLAYFYVLPASLKFFQLFSGPSFEQAYTGREYFSLLFMMIITFGLAFELPIVIIAATALGLVTPDFLRKYRRHAFVLCIVGSALMTPGDAMTATVAMIIPLYFLYELGIFLAQHVYRWRQRREAPEDASQDAPHEAEQTA